jgi:hypothetical protein
MLTTIATIWTIGAACSLWEAIRASLARASSK